MLVLEVEDAFGTLPTLHDVYGSACELTMNGEPIALPERAGGGVSTEVAAFLLELFGGTAPSGAPGGQL
jgi:hypothetical protein